jgi:hypothetical protein
MKKYKDRRSIMATFILWLILLIICWPLALLALLLYPIIWLLSLPFRFIGITMDGLFAVLKEIFLIPIRILEGNKVTR